MRRHALTTLALTLLLTAGCNLRDDAPTLDVPDGEDMTSTEDMPPLGADMRQDMSAPQDMSTADMSSTPEDMTEAPADMGSEQDQADCTPEPDEDLCVAQGAECGELTVVDRCGQMRAVTCGTCTDGATCQPDNTCVACPAPSCDTQSLCGEVTNDCGASITCYCDGLEACLSGQCGRTELTAPAGAVADAFGTSVAMAGDLLVVGAPNRDQSGKDQAGGAHVFERDPNTGSWTHLQELAPDTWRGGGQFGRAVAITDEEIFIGEPGFDGAGNSGERLIDSGAVYVFLRSPQTGEWVQAQRLQPNTPRDEGYFGSAIAVDDPNLVIGAPNKDEQTSGAWLFTRSGAIWSHRQELREDALDTLNMGAAVAIDGDHIAVGAPSLKKSGGGKVALYELVSGSWTWRATIDANSADLNRDYFGQAVALEGDQLLVGAPRTNLDEGAIYHFVRDASTGDWARQGALPLALPPDIDNARLGESLAIDRGRALVGAPQAKINGADRAGLVMLLNYEAGSETWKVSRTLQATPPLQLDFFGAGLALEGSVGLASAPLRDTAGGVDAGLIYVFDAP